MHGYCAARGQREIPSFVFLPSCDSETEENICEPRKGLLCGIYTDVGPKTCAGYEGSYNHDEIDAKTCAQSILRARDHPPCSCGGAPSRPAGTARVHTLSGRGRHRHTTRAAHRSCSTPTARRPPTPGGRYANWGIDFVEEDSWCAAAPRPCGPCAA